MHENDDTNEMHRSRTTLRALVSGLATALAIVISLLTGWEPISQLIFPGGQYLNPRSVSLLLVSVVVLAFLFFRWRLDRSREKQHSRLSALRQQHATGLQRIEEKLEITEARLRDERLKNQDLRQKLHESERQRLRDLITLVPNQEKLQRDIEKYAKDPAERLVLQVIFIDLDNFGSINKRFGFEKGDKLIRMIAQNIYQRTRRNEEMYKRMPDGIDPNSPWVSRMYRTYTGGDEFVFLLRGDQYEAVGFLNRLSDQLEALSDETTDLLGEKFDISFNAAITQLYRSDSYEDVMSRVSSAYMFAAEHKGGLKLWWDEQEERRDLSNDNPEERSFAERMYTTARKKFAVGSPSGLPPEAG